LRGGATAGCIGLTASRSKGKFACCCGGEGYLGLFDAHRYLGKPASRGALKRFSKAAAGRKSRAWSRGGALGIAGLAIHQFLFSAKGVGGRILKKLTLPRRRLRSDAKGQICWSESPRKGPTGSGRSRKTTRGGKKEKRIGRTDQSRSQNRVRKRPNIWNCTDGGRIPQGNDGRCRQVTQRKREKSMHTKRKDPCQGDILGKAPGSAASMGHETHEGSGRDWRSGAIHVWLTSCTQITTAKHT